MADRFVWLRHPFGLRPCPERWPADAPSGCIQPDRIIVEHELGPDHAGLSLDELAAKYPPPAQSEDQSP